MSTYTKHFPTFSIITITLNNLTGLQKTYKSIEKQSFTDVQWIVIDGNSTDDTVDFLRQRRTNTRSDKIPFSFISEEDHGIYDAMNKGIAQANGHYLLFLNAGDELANENTLKTLYPLTKKKPSFIYGDALEPQTNRKKPIYKASRRYKDLAWGMITHHQAMLYRRHTIRDFKLRYSLRYKIASDYDFTVRFLLKAKKIVYINKPICIFEQGGISQQNATLGRKEQYIIRENLDMIPQPKNLWILCVQTISWRLKNAAPAFYRGLKSIILKVIDSKNKDTTS
ncbi:MAG: hypothetical protein COA45_08690 [Zetaproteobacteria bacterium]|nr:MAG: hypothetical protein COA45_08690 [Zetaproteobacteria bacterium]